MMKIVAILISNLILIQSLNINLESFAKLNVLLEHAQFHQENTEIVCLSFFTNIMEIKIC